MVIFTKYIRPLINKFLLNTYIKQGYVNRFLKEILDRTTIKVISIKCKSNIKFKYTLVYLFKNEH